jgi:Ca-activated chloride channel family protein
MSFYYAENFAEAIKLFELLETPAGRFNYANALAQGEHYVKAVQTYSDLLQDFPDHQGALKNRLIVQQIVDDINRMSESQRDEPGKASRELGDLPQRGEGAEQLNSTPQLVEQLTAEQLLTDLQIHEMWMRQVQVDPSRFLAAKFQLQYNTMSSAAKSGLEQ